MFLIDIHFNFEISTYKTMLSFLILLSTALTLSSAWSDSEYLVSLDGVDDDNHSGKYIKYIKVTLSRLQGGSTNLETLLRANKSNNKS